MFRLRSEACKIFVGGLAPEITEKEFGDYFSKFGIVKDAVVMVDRNTGSSRGFGFVTFEAEDTVDSVMKIQHEIMGKYVEIKRAEPRDSRWALFLPSWSIFFDFFQRWQRI
jgi:RNA-binding protein Musashi